MYVTGRMTEPVVAQHVSMQVVPAVLHVACMGAMSAIEHPALMLGSTTSLVRPGQDAPPPSPP